MTMVPVNSTADQVLGLQAGRAQAALQSKAANAYVEKQTKGALKALPGVVLIDGKASAGYAGIAIKKGSSLVKAMKTALNALIKNGKYGKILKKWGVQEAAVKKALVNNAASG
jgi:polar amino acid transport system substrate-binding protein